MKFSIRDMFLVTLIVAILGVRFVDGKEDIKLFGHGLTEGNDRPINGHKETFSWQEVIGQRVRVEGIAWGSVEKGLGEYVIMNDAKIFVDKGSFLDKRVYGRTVSVTGVLRLKTVGGNSPVRIFIIEDAIVRAIEKVESPWMERANKTLPNSPPPAPNPSKP